MIRMGAQVKITKLTNVSQNDITSALTKAAIIVEGEAKRLCPVMTGRLQKSISHRMVSPNEQMVYAATDYAELVEYGTAKTGYYDPKDPKIYTSSAGKYPSYRPFLRTALYMNEKRITDLFNELMRKKVK